MCTMISTFWGVRTRLKFKVPSRFASNGTINSWRVLTPLNVVYHCPHPFRWAYFCPSPHTMQQRTMLTACPQGWWNSKDVKEICPNQSSLYIKLVEQFAFKIGGKNLPIFWNILPILEQIFLLKIDRNENFIMQSGY